MILIFVELCIGVHLYVGFLEILVHLVMEVGGGEDNM